MKLLFLILLVILFPSPGHTQEENLDISEKHAIGVPSTDWLKLQSGARNMSSMKYNKYGFIVTRPDVIPLHEFPKDKYDFIDWSRAMKEGMISPLDSVDGDEEISKMDEPFSEDVIIKSKQDFMSDVLFPHEPHNRWFKCSPCHPSIFAMKAGGTENLSMIGIWKGEFCGRCHDKVAFPIRNCFRCHSVPRVKK